MEPQIDILQLTEKLLGTLDARSRDVVTRRFGLKGGETETLEAIGKEYGITRERVRQIESNTKKTLANLREQAVEAVSLFEEVFATHGGVMTESHVVEVTRTQPALVRFYLHVLPEYKLVSKHELFHPHWHHEQHAHEKAEAIVTCACEVLALKQAPTTQDELMEAIQKRMNETALSGERVIAALVASRNVERTIFNQWGLVTWPEVSPRGVGDKAYAVLRRHGQPMHFREIARMISEAGFDSKGANPQTVHNELIKDKRFVLVGRGLYGLQEWGYVPGTVADVLEAILRKQQRPMTREELVEEVLKQRLVKKNTILLGLQNSKRFAKAGGSRYQVR